MIWFGLAIFAFAQGFWLLGVVAALMWLTREKR